MCLLCVLFLPQASLQSKKERGRTSGNKLEKILQQLLESNGERWTEELRGDIPRNFQRHGDLVLLGDNCFSLPLWKKMNQQLWSAVARGLGAKRLARMSRISRDGFRSPVVTMLLGEHSWVKHVDNGISYEFDVTKCMFSAGNITEKLRLQLCDVADQVNLGLIPSSEDSWPIACRLLKKTTGGILHIHQNVTSPLPNTAAIPAINDATQRVSGKKADREVWHAWADDTANRITSLLKDITGKSWITNIRHIEHVKSYAPRIHHVVLDLECRPS
eukprot:superscaffoldBa00001191_g9430